MPQLEGGWTQTRQCPGGTAGGRRVNTNSTVSGGTAAGRRVNTNSTVSGGTAAGRRVNTNSIVFVYPFWVRRSAFTLSGCDGVRIPFLGATEWVYHFWVRRSAFTLSGCDGVRLPFLGATEYVYPFCASLNFFATISLIVSTCVSWCNTVKAVHLKPFFKEHQSINYANKMYTMFIRTSWYVYTNTYTLSWNITTAMFRRIRGGASVSALQILNLVDFIYSFILFHDLNSVRTYS